MFFRHTLWACCDTLRPHLAPKIKKNPVVESLPSDPLELNSPQAFVCLPCSIYTLYVCGSTVAIAASFKKHPENWNSQHLTEPKNVGKTLNLLPVLTETSDVKTSYCTFAQLNHYISYGMLSFCVFMGGQPHLPNNTAAFYFYCAFCNHNTVTRKGKNTHSS